MHSCIHKNDIHKWFSRNLETFFVNITGTMDQKRSIKKYTFRNSSAKELKELATLVPNLDNFKNRYGKLISILKTKVEKGILETLVQFYDPVYHCFTFLIISLCPLWRSILIGLVYRLRMTYRLVVWRKRLRLMR